MVHYFMIIIILLIISIVIIIIVAHHAQSRGRQSDIKDKKMLTAYDGVFIYSVTKV